MPTLYLPIGVAGSGKSTYYHQSQLDTFATYISADQVRADVNHDPKPDPQTETQVWQIVNQQLKDAFASHQDIYYDNTNRSRKYRSNLYHQAHGHGYHVVAIWFIRSFVQLVAQDQQRSQAVGRQIQWQQLCTIEPPVTNIDCDDIIVSPPSSDFKLDLSASPEQFSAQFMALSADIQERYLTQMSLPEADLYHADSMHDHNKNVQSLAQSLYGNRYPILSDIGRWHDIGKLYVRSFDPMYCRVHYYNHEILSSYLYATYQALKGNYVDNDRAMDTVRLIRWHMQPFNGKFSQKLIKREQLSSDQLELIKLFHQLDLAASSSN